MSKHEETPRRPASVQTGTGYDYGNGQKPKLVIEQHKGGRPAPRLLCKAKTSGRHRSSDNE